MKNIKIENIYIKKNESYRPKSFDEFIWQENIKDNLKIIWKAFKNWEKKIGHILFFWESWYWKTTLASIFADYIWVDIKIVTAYAIEKPAQIISILTNLKDGDILFIDEIHRLKNIIEEILYIAMEDYLIDIVDQTNIRIPLNKFCLIWATTKLENLSQPLKNRFTYKFLFEQYTEEERFKIFMHYLKIFDIKHDLSKNDIIKYIPLTPREIYNLAFFIKNYYKAKKLNLFSLNEWKNFLKISNIDYNWLSSIHKKYIEILKNSNKPVWIKTLSAKLWISEKSIENDIEPLLLKLWIIERTSRWRILI